MHSRSCSLRRVLTYVWILALLLLCVASIRGAFLPSKLPGFRCDDPDIRHPFRGDTVTLGQILLLVVVVPGPLLALVEWWANPCGPRDWGVVRSAFRHYVIGLELVSVSVEVVKSLVTQPRPHFLDSCRPDWDRLDCSRGLVTQYECTNKESRILVDMHKSFPSGHAALGFYLFTFVAIYSRFRLSSTSSHRSRAWNGVLSACLLLLACLNAASRVYDRRHHAVDVLAGSLFGLLGGLAAARWLVSNCRQRQETKSR